MTTRPTFYQRVKPFYRRKSELEKTTDTPFGVFGEERPEDDSNENQQEILKMLQEVSLKKKTFEEQKASICLADCLRRRSLVPLMQTDFESFKSSFEALLEKLCESQTTLTLTLTQVSPNLFRVCVQSLLNVELGKMFKVALPSDFTGMNEAHKRTICEGVKSRAQFHVNFDLVGTQIIDLSVAVDDLNRKVAGLEKQVARLSFRQIANVLRNRLEKALNEVGFFVTDERQMKDYSMTDYHFMYKRWKNQRKGEKFTQPQAKVYSQLLSEAFPNRFGDKKMEFLELSRRVAELFSGVLEFARDVAHNDDVRIEDVQKEVDQLKQEDIKDLKRPFKTNEVRELFEALKIAHKQVDAKVPLLTMEKIDFPKPTDAEDD